MAFPGGTARLTMTGSEYAYVIPDDVRSIEFQAFDADVAYYFTAGDDANKVTIFTGQSKTFTNPNVARKTIYLLGTNTKIVEVTYMTGTMS